MGKGWLGAPFKEVSACAKCKKEARKAGEPCGVGSRGPLKGPGRVQGAKLREARKFYNAGTTFSTQTYIHKVH